MKFGPFKSIIILGGGGLVQDLIPWITKKKIPLGIITSPRQSKQIIEIIRCVYHIFHHVHALNVLTILTIFLKNLTFLC